MASGGWTFGLTGACLAVGAVVLLFYRDMSTMDPWYLLLIAGVSAGLSFLVGYVLGYLTGSGLVPSSEDRE
ncbi:MAG: hypothetical protein LN414_08140 [Candidatus Thermoplasmatota archaeon]|nr:hypothetical protein [Candidatus Thermoplasmatota archaeon]